MSEGRTMRFMVRLKSPEAPSTLSRRPDRLRWFKQTYTQMRERICDFVDAAGLDLDVGEAGCLPFLIVEGPDNIPTILSTSPDVEGVFEDIPLKADPWA